MQDKPKPHRALLACGALSVIALAGCQRYRSQPLDLDAHHVALSTRLNDRDSIADFLDRLAEQGAAAPDHFDPTDGLSREEGEILALFYNADLRHARLDAGIALATADNAGLWQDPTLGFNGTELLSPSGPFEYGLTLGLTLPISGRLGIEQDRADAAYHTELRRIVDMEWDTRAAVRSAWAEWSAAETHSKLIRETIDRIEQVESVTAKLESIGELTRVEARLVRAETARFKAYAIEDELNRIGLRSTLLGLMGLPGDADVTLLPDLRTDAPISLDNPIDQLIRRNTLLGVKRAEYQTAEDSLRLEIRKQYPDLQIGAGYGSENNDDRLLLGASIAIPVFNANRAGIAEARAERERSRATAETTFELLTRQLARAQAKHTATKAQLDTYETVLVPMLDEQYREITHLLELGEVETLLLLETLTRQQEAMSTLIDLKTSEVLARIEIERLLGPDRPLLPFPVASESHTQSTPSKTTTMQTKGGDQ